MKNKGTLRLICNIIFAIIFVTTVVLSIISLVKNFGNSQPGNAFTVGITNAVLISIAAGIMWYLVDRTIINPSSRTLIYWFAFLTIAAKVICFMITIQDIEYKKVLLCWFSMVYYLLAGTTALICSKRRWAVKFAFIILSCETLVIYFGSLGLSVVKFVASVFLPSHYILIYFLPKLLGVAAGWTYIDAVTILFIFIVYTIFLAASVILRKQYKRRVKRHIR